MLIDLQKMQELNEHLRSILLPTSFVSVPFAEDGYVSLRQQTGLSGEGDISQQTSENWRSKAIRRKLSKLKELVLFVGDLPTNLKKSDYVKRLSVFSSKRDDACVGPIFPDHGCLFISFTSGMAAACMLRSLHERKVFGRSLNLIFLPFISVPATAPISTYDPLLVFINSKSGGGQGKQVLEMMKTVLNKNQVFLLELGGPMPGLYAFRKLPRFRILVCGGDGTAGWVLSALEQLHRYIACKNPPIAVLPLGTGNDLARVLGFGSGWSGESVSSILTQVQEAAPVEMDRWTILFDASPQAQLSSTDSDSARKTKHTHDTKTDTPPTTKNEKVINGHRPLQRTCKGEVNRPMVNIVMGIGDDGWKTENKRHLPEQDQHHVLAKKLSNGNSETESISEDINSKTRNLTEKLSNGEIAHNFLVKKLSNGDVDHAIDANVHDDNSVHLHDSKAELTKKLSNGHSENDNRVLTKKLSNGDSDHNIAANVHGDNSVHLPNTKAPLTEKLSNGHSGIDDEILTKKLSNGDDSSLSDSETSELILPTEKKDLLEKKLSNGCNLQHVIEGDNLINFDSDSNIAPDRLCKKTSNGEEIKLETNETEHIKLTEKLSNGHSDHSGTHNSTDVTDNLPHGIGDDAEKQSVSSSSAGDSDDLNEENVSTSPETSNVCLKKESVNENRKKSAHRKLHILSSSDILDNSDAAFNSFGYIGGVSKCDSLESDDESNLTENATSVPEGVILRQGGVDEFVNEILRSELPDIINDKQKLITLLNTDNADLELDKIIRKSMSQEECSFAETSNVVDAPTVVNDPNAENSSFNTLITESCPSIERHQDNARHRSFSTLEEGEEDMCRRREYKKKMSLPLIEDDHKFKILESRLGQIAEVEKDVPSPEETGAGPKVVTMNNYFGMGIDAELSLAFHLAREENPEKFSSRLHNKAVYLKAGLKKMASRSTQLNNIIDLEVDGKKIGLPSIKGLIFLNISSWAGGANAWGSGASKRFHNPSFGDGLLEVVAVGGVAHMSQMYSGIRNGFRIAQGEYIRLYLHNEVAVQVDGEPWMQPPGQIIITVSALQVMMLKRQKKKAR